MPAAMHEWPMVFRARPPTTRVRASVLPNGMSVVSAFQTAGRFWAKLTKLSLSGILHCFLAGRFELLEPGLHLAPPGAGPRSIQQTRVIDAIGIYDQRSHQSTNRYQLVWPTRRRTRRTVSTRQPSTNGIVSLPSGTAVPPSKGYVCPAEDATA